MIIKIKRSSWHYQYLYHKPGLTPTNFCEYTRKLFFCLLLDACKWLYYAVIFIAGASCVFILFISPFLGWYELNTLTAIVSFIGALIWVFLAATFLILFNDTDKGFRDRIPSYLRTVVYDPPPSIKYYEPPKFRIPWPTITIHRTIAKFVRETAKLLWSWYRMTKDKYCPKLEFVQED